MSAGKSGQQSYAENVTGQRGQQMMTDLQQQQGLTGAAQGALGQFEGPVQQSPFYKALLNSGIEQTSGAYNAADANLRQQANLAGFGYQQPVTQGAEAQLGAQEAKTMAQLPQEAMLGAAGPALSAAQQSGNLGTQYGNQALQFGGQQLGANQQAANLQQQRNQANAGLWSTLAGVGGDILGGPIGGAIAGGLTKKFMGGGDPYTGQDWGVGGN